MIKHVQSAILFLIVQTAVAQQNYTVSKKGKIRTIQAAANLARPGDTVTVLRGIYRERVDPPRGNVVYRAARGQHVEIRGSEVIKGWRRVDRNTWMVSIPNAFFGDFNPYSDVIRGDWYDGKGWKQHTGAVYLDGRWLMEAPARERLPEKEWWANVDKDSTEIWANFANIDPNRALTEINVRRTVFYPSRTGINNITVSGFIMQQAATPWAPPTAGQVGLVGTNWSRGWVIEGCDIRYSKCSGIALGKYGDAFDNTSANSAEGYVETVNRALHHGWHKDSVGHHIVRNNTVSFCEQAGIVGSLGCSFSRVTGNIIHDIHMERRFSGAEMGAIKFHGAVDLEISNNHVYHNYRGIWLDWMAQGARISGNLLYDNDDWDIYFEVDHGPVMVDNNTMLSPNSQKVWSQGIAYVHNFISGRFEVTGDGRETPVLAPHKTDVLGLRDNPTGDIRLFNNIFTGRDVDLAVFDGADLPVAARGNIYANGAAPTKSEPAPFMWEKEDTKVPALFNQNGKAFLQFQFPSQATGCNPVEVTSDLLGKTSITGQAFENPDGTPIVFNRRYPAPFENVLPGKGKVRLQVPGKVTPVRFVNRSVTGNWHLLDPWKDGFYGISLQQANELLRSKHIKTREVIVAVIDAGTDTAHEIFNNRLWTNDREVPGNGIDDDHNGYTDDIHGWNFLGGIDGRNVSNDALETDRVYFRYKDRFSGDTAHVTATGKRYLTGIEKLTPMDKRLYETWKTAAALKQAKLEKLQDPLPYEAAVLNLHRSDSLLQIWMGRRSYNLSELDTAKPSDRALTDARNYLAGILHANHVTGGSSVADFIDGFAAYATELRGQRQQALIAPPAYRGDITRDDEEDLEDRNYGNPNVQGESYYHGTHVAGIICNIAPTAKIMTLRVVPNGDEHDKDITLAIRYAVDKGARVINMSFGKPLSPHKEWIDEAVRYAAQKNVLLVHAAGNDNSNIDTTLNFPTATLLDGERATNWIEVGASGDMDRELGGSIKAGFSNYGRRSVDLFAPGVRIRSSAPGNKYEAQNGTSMAAPVVSGVAAYILACYPGIKAARLKQLLEQSATKPLEATLLSYSRTGGIVNLYQAMKVAMN